MRRYDDDARRGNGGGRGPGNSGPPPPPETDGEPSNQWIFDKLVDREKARVKRDFGTADQIRDELASHGVRHKPVRHFFSRSPMLTLSNAPSLGVPQVEIWESKGERTWRSKDGRMGPRPNHEGKCF